MLKPQVYAYRGLTPVIGEGTFVHPSAVLIGDVIIGARCYIGPCASLRGDFGRIVVEDGANVQDCCVMHSFPGRDAHIEADGHIGHGAVLHGCRIGAGALVGMNAVVMDGAVVGAQSIVAAMAFVKAGFEAPPRSLIVGMPAKVVRAVTDEELSWKQQGTREYQELAQFSLETMVPAEPLATPEPDRRRHPAPEGLGPLNVRKARAAG